MLLSFIPNYLKNYKIINCCIMNISLITDIIVPIIAVLVSMFFIVILLSFMVGKTKSNLMSILHINLTVISLLQAINYMFFFDVDITSDYKSREPSFLCQIQGSMIPSFGVAQISILFLIGFMMKKIFNNPDDIELYTKTTYIILIIFGWLIPIGLFLFSLLGKGTRLTISGFCRPGVNNYVYIGILMLSTIVVYVLFFYSIISLGNTIKAFFQNKEEERESVRFLTKLRRYNYMLIGASFKWVVDLGLFIVAYKYKEEQTGTFLMWYTCLQNFVEIFLIPFFTLTFTLTGTRKQAIIDMFQCKTREEDISWKKEYFASTEDVNVTEFPIDSSKKLLA